MKKRKADYDSESIELQQRDNDVDESASNSSSYSTTFSSSSSVSDRKKKSKKKKTSDKRHKKSSNKSKKLKKEKKNKKNKKSHRKNKKKRKDDDENDDDMIADDDNHNNRYELNYQLADAIYELIHYHPVFSEELPILLIKLANGATLNLSQVPSPIGDKLRDIFQCLSSFGLINTEDISSTNHHPSTSSSSCWRWEHVVNNSTSSSNHDLVLVKIVRTLLDQIGITMAMIDRIEHPSTTTTMTNTSSPPKKNQHRPTMNARNDDMMGIDNSNITKNVAKKHSNNRYDNNDMTTTIRQLTIHFIRQFVRNDDNNNNNNHNHENDILFQVADLITLCDLLLDDQMISIDDISNETLRKALGLLLESCGLIKSEMILNDDDEANNSDNNHDVSELASSYGYGLPEGTDDNIDDAKSLLNTVRDTCKTVMPLSPSSPLRNDNNDPSNSDTDEDEAGPMIAGTTATTRKGLPSRPGRDDGEMMLQQEEDQQQQQRREEWMMTPGKYDIFHNMESGRAIKSRTFQQGKSGVASANKPDNPTPIDPIIQQEIQAMRHEENKMRGPSLLEIHLQNKKNNTDTTKQNHKHKPWQWNRDDDLAAGRGVDKDALRMIMGDAKKDLKTKFHGTSGM